MSIISRSELPAWVTPKAPEADEIAVYCASGDLVTQYLWRLKSGRLTDPRATIHGPNGETKGVPHHPPDVLIAAAVEAKRRTDPPPPVEVSFGAGDLVWFTHRDGVAVGYIDSIDSIDSAADVVAHVVHPGRWKVQGNLSLMASCWRVAIDSLHLLRKARRP